MKTVNEVSKLTGVSIRTLQYYDKIGLLKPAEYTESGYRLYDDAALERLQQILLFRELEFPLKDIKDIVTRSDFDKRLALDQQIRQVFVKDDIFEIGKTKMEYGRLMIPIYGLGILPATYGCGRSGNIKNRNDKKNSFNKSAVCGKKIKWRLLWK